jgi:LDH2 family malate/lactate/ureidoglycolate dehydrogenase
MYSARHDRVYCTSINLEYGNPKGFGISFVVMVISGQLMGRVEIPRQLLKPTHHPRREQNTGNNESSSIIENPFFKIT